MPRLADVLAVLDALYAPGWAEPWDAVGLVCGDPDAVVTRVLLAVDPVAPVADEAVRLGAQLLVTHHPLFLRPVHGVAATTVKGRLVHALVTAGVALHVAHTNADVARPGVSDALAGALGLDPAGTEPLAPSATDPTDKLVTFVPDDAVDTVLDALSAAGAGVIGAYTRCAWTTGGTGTFRPEAGARPVVGAVGRVESVAETRLEVVLPRERRDAIVHALLASHPYEEPAYDVYELATSSGARGLGRVGELGAPVPLRAFARRAAAALPRTAGGVRVAGDPDRPVRRVAVCGGAGESLLTAAGAARADVYVTADLRHHPASEALADAGVRGGPALVDAAHWASEWPWLPDAATRLREALGDTVETVVSTLVTDPWTVQETA